MTEEEWLTYRSEPKVMLSWLRTKATNRKKRLFGCACCRRIWNLIGNEKSRSAVLLAERFADGLLTDGDRAAAYAEAEAVARQPSSSDQHERALRACANVLHKYAGIAINASYNAAQVAQWHALVTAALYGSRSEEAASLNTLAYNDELAQQCGLVRELFGNPFRPMPPRRGKRQWEAQRRRWLDANDGVARKVAEVIYDQGSFSEAPILADTLEEAGCGEAGLLDHLRGPGPHIRGCWAVDFVLAKE
jgi:hypothetical protein